ncbi:type I restriction-modification system subunit M [Methanosarcina sp. Mfa9]|uniref:type I restriction-modification system subunit M n=1 Tax=Methanosarcina sp. Mfa9 TaxID=3439063 RepID=UPI003F87A6E5
MSPANSHVSQQELEQYLWGAANLLRGGIDPGEYKNIIFPLMFFKRISDVYEEEFEEALQESDGDLDYARFAEHHRFMVPDGAHWKDVREVTTNVGEAIRKAMREIEKANPDKLSGIFGDGNWTNKDRMSDKLLIDLLEHFSNLNLSIKNVPQDQFGNAYEYLIRKFADDSGHTAAEFYTNRTVVELMTLIMAPKSGESIYDPTCGSGGMLLNSIILAKENGEEYRNIKLYGQEINLITSAIARMNMFIHDVGDFSIIRGDTLANPAFIENDRVQQFDMVIANPPYSIKKWNQKAWTKDPFGRNIYGTPPQGCADYAFFQHIICSMKEDTGRCAILYPHGVLFRDSEQSMRAKLIEDDYVDCVIGLGPNLFYNSPMEACIVICRKNKPAERKGKILFINGFEDVIQEKQQAFLSDENIQTLFDLYTNYGNVPRKSYVASMEEVKEKDYNLNVPLYVEKYDLGEINEPLEVVIQEWTESSHRIKEANEEIFSILSEVGLNDQ